MLASILLCAAGCGESNKTASTATPTATPTATATPRPTPTAIAPSAPEPPEDIPPEEQEGGAGDEQAARGKVRLTIDGEGITPPAVAVRGFLALEFVIRNDTPRRLRVSFRGRSATVRPMATGRLRVPGVRPGSYRIEAAAAGSAEVVAAPPDEP